MTEEIPYVHEIDSCLQEVHRPTVTEDMGAYLIRNKFRVEHPCHRGIFLHDVCYTGSCKWLSPSIEEQGTALRSSFIQTIFFHIFLEKPYGLSINRNYSMF